jgi:DNA ligase-1
MSVRKPMLAYTIEDTSTLNYPAYISIKLDGIRVLVIDGVVYSRSMKPIRSKAVQELFGKECYNGLDGEILYGPWNAPNVFNLTTQTVMATELKPQFSKGQLRMAVFDYTSGGQYNVRNKIASEIVAMHGFQMEMLGQDVVACEQDLLDYETWALNQGYEGVMVRSIRGLYKEGRSTEKEGTIGKLKRFSDDEALVIGFEEKQTNTNEKTINELGNSVRSQAMSGMVGANTLGAIVCTCKGITFSMGSGFDDATRDEIWNNKEKYIGALAKFKHFEVGQKDSYRFPIFLGWRDVQDMS